MDGNGRWAQNKGKERAYGHKIGAKVAREITTHCAIIGVKYLTLYAFSTENWSRPKQEVNFLMRLLQHYLRNELDIYLKNNIRFKAIGNLKKFNQNLQNEILFLEKNTEHCTGLTQVLALNYGSKDEIARAVKKITKKNKKITKKNINNNLDTKNIPSVDLLIRTGGECRISNFLLWQIAYAELFFVKSYWPNFTKEKLDLILSNFKKRERKFGGI